MTSEPIFRTPILQRIYTVLRSEVDPEFSFVSPGPIPWSRPAAPLGETRVALVSTAGFHLRGDPPFRSMEQKLGDTSFRVIPHGTVVTKLVVNAPYVDDKYAARDIEVAMPMKALDALRGEGLVGAPSPRHYCFCSGIVRPLPGLATSAEQVAASLREDDVGAVVLLPTCSLCVQATCVIARELEARGVSTVVVSLLPELSEIIGAPRTLTVRFPFGAPCGNPGNSKLHRAVLYEALTLLAEAESPGEIRPSRHTWRRSPDPPR